MSHNKFLLIFGLLLGLGLAPRAGRACDICGCFMGITPYDNQSGLSLMHRYRIFNGYQALGQAPQFFPGGARPFFPRPSTATTATSPQTTTATRPTSKPSGCSSCAASTSSRAAWS